MLFHFVLVQFTCFVRSVLVLTVTATVAVILASKVKRTTKQKQCN